MKRAEILELARKCVCGEREREYGKPENNFALIGRLWEAYTGNSYTAKDVAMMLALLKVARIKTGVKGDSFVDLAGYAACAGEIVTEACGHPATYAHAASSGTEVPDLKKAIPLTLREGDVKMNKLTAKEEEAWTAEMVRISDIAVRSILSAADLRNIDRDSAIQFFAELFLTVANVATFEHFELES